jgi:murein DD-endopeptidase MepM/ murein hydrolase activator NlpD
MKNPLFPVCLALGLALFRGSPLVASPSLPSPYPRLGSLGPDDAIYAQQQEQLAASYSSIARGGSGPALVLYVYEARANLDLFSLAARLNLPYDSLATLNRLDRMRAVTPGESILVPSAPGIFVPETLSSDLEYLLSYRGQPGGGVKGESVVLSSDKGASRFLFYRGERFSAEERALFLGYLFRLPLAAAQLSSGYGPRINPVTGHAGVHQGVDLAAPFGSEVYAARDGRVSASGIDPILGEYIVLTHEGKWQTVYGHLSKRLVRLNDRIESGMIIGRVGSTGQSTGPHLHFEVRVNGQTRDPEALIPKVKR